MNLMCSVPREEKSLHLGFVFQLLLCTHSDLGSVLPPGYGQDSIKKASPPQMDQDPSQTPLV